MHFQVDVTSAAAPLSAQEVPCSPPDTEVADLLKELIAVQREQLAYQQAAVESQNQVGRWQAFLDRWSEDFPTLGADCRRLVPVLERAFGQLVNDLSEHVRDQGDELDNEFMLREMLDRFGPSLAHLGSVLNMVAPLAEAGSLGDS